MLTALPTLLARLHLLTRPRPRCMTATARLRLPAGALLRAAGPLALRPTHGTLWVTQPNDPADHLLTPGQCWRTSHPGPILIQSLTPSTFTLRAPTDALQLSSPRRNPLT